LGAPFAEIMLGLRFDFTVLRDASEQDRLNAVRMTPETKKQFESEAYRYSGGDFYKVCEAASTVAVAHGHARIGVLHLQHACIGIAPADLRWRFFAGGEAEYLNRIRRYFDRFAPAEPDH
jgi:hypothetical protein